MMDLKEIIKWFIPCFHILLVINRKDFKWTFVCLFLLFNFRVGCAASVKSLDLVDTKNDSYNFKLKVNQSDVLGVKEQARELPQYVDGSIGRTFGRPFKKMIGALIPVIFQIGAASTWAVVAALVGVKTLVVSLVILKILLIAGAAKVGALFGSKGHGHQSWEPPHPQKEIHLHIHNGHHDATHDDHAPVYGPWSREDPNTLVEPKHPVIDPYSMIGPQTIRTPFGNYVKVESNEPPLHPTKRKR